jgi:hypothetical protein
VRLCATCGRRCCSCTEAPVLVDLRRYPVLAVDLNHGHLAAWLRTEPGRPEELAAQLGETYWDQTQLPKTANGAIRMSSSSRRR